MFLTIVMKLNEEEEFLEEAAGKYTGKLLELTDKILEREETNLDYIGHKKLVYEARARARLIKEKKIRYEDPQDLHCVFKRQEFTVNSETRQLEFNYRDKKVNYTVNRYQKLLLKKMEPVYLQVGKIDNQWYGWLLGSVVLEDYLDLRKQLYLENSGSDDKKETSTSM